jgi:hypothetical protein
VVARIHVRAAAWECRPIPTCVKLAVSWSVSPPFVARRR